MTKNLVIVAALMTMCGGVMAQDEGNYSGGSGASLNTNNKLQVSLLLGNAGMFDQETTYLLPKYGDNNLGFGFEEGQSDDPGTYLMLNDLGEGSICNMAGIQFSYYVANAVDVNLSFGMDLRSTPKKDYVENFDAQGMNVQGAKWVEGQLKNNWLLNAGGNYHFSVSNKRIDVYAGGQAGYQHGQITANRPYTDTEAGYLSVNSTEGEVTREGEAETLYFPRSRAGQINTITGAVIAGVNYSLAEGLILGLEFSPYTFQYSMLELCPKGARVYQTVHTTNRFFASPMLKLGFRF